MNTGHIKNMIEHRGFSSKYQNYFLSVSEFVAFCSFLLCSMFSSISRAQYRPSNSRNWHENILDYAEIQSDIPRALLICGTTTSTYPMTVLSSFR